MVVLPALTAALVLGEFVLSFRKLPRLRGERARLD
jgi:hypothetical protein